MKFLLLPGFVVSLLCMASAGSAVAQPAPDQEMAGAAFSAVPADAAVLDASRGGAQIAHSEMTLTGTTSGNTAHHMSTGTNTISSGSFANMNGLPTVIQNSGANVLIQNATIVHLELTP